VAQFPPLRTRRGRDFDGLTKVVLGLCGGAVIAHQDSFAFEPIKFRFSEVRSRPFDSRKVLVDHRKRSVVLTIDRVLVVIALLAVALAFAHAVVRGAVSVIFICPNLAKALGVRTYGHEGLPGIVDPAMAITLIMVGFALALAVLAWFVPPSRAIGSETREHIEAHRGPWTFDPSCCLRVNSGRAQRSEAIRMVRRSCIAGTAQIMEQLGFRPPRLQAVVACLVEGGAGLALAAGLLTPLAAAAFISVMFVARYYAARGRTQWTRFAVTVRRSIVDSNCLSRSVGR